MELIHSLKQMRGYKTKTWLGILLASLILLQLLYHTIHVFGSHLPDSHIENFSHKSQIDKSTIDCDLCAKLLGKTIYLWVFTAALIIATASVLPKDLWQQVLIPEFQIASPLRGPPSTLI